MLKERNCAISSTLEVFGDGWTSLILRESFFGVTRFEQFQRMLGLPRTTLSSRLTHLTELGLLTAQLYSDKPPRRDYKLTDAGISLYPVYMALMAFGDRWLADQTGKPVQLIHRSCGLECSALVICPHCKKKLTTRDVSYHDGPGAGFRDTSNDTDRRRSADPTVLERTRPSSVARTLKLMGDRWSVLILREAFWKRRRFDDLQIALGIAPNILSDRLSRFVEQGVFDRVLYRVGPERFEYRLTPKGKDLFGPLMAMQAWGDAFVWHEKPPKIMHHEMCRKDFDPTVVCDKCFGALRAREMEWRLNYRDPLTP